MYRNKKLESVFIESITFKGKNTMDGWFTNTPA